MLTKPVLAENKPDFPILADFHKKIIQFLLF